MRVSGRKTGFVMGSFWRIDDRTGFRVRAEDSKKEWNNLIVREQSFEMRQPQDFVTGVMDDQTVPEARPRQVNRFINTNPNDTGGEFQVYGDLPSGPGPSFLVQNNVGPAYNPGNTNDGTASIQELNGTIPMIDPDDYPAGW